MVWARRAEGQDIPLLPLAAVAKPEIEAAEALLCFPLDGETDTGERGDGADSSGAGKLRTYR